MAITPVVTDAIHDAGRRNRDPHHLYGPDRQADRPKQRDVDNQHQTDTVPGKARIDVALDPVLGRTATIPFERFEILRLVAVKLGAFPEDLLDATRLRAVRIFVGFNLSVVLAVDGDPLLGHHARGEPQPEAEKVADCRMEIEAPMGLASMQVDGD